MSLEMPGGERKAIPNVVSVEDFKARRAAEIERLRIQEENRLAKEFTESDALIDFNGDRGDERMQPDRFMLPPERD